MGPAEGARYLGINKCCRVVMNGRPVPPFDDESEKLCSMNEVVWSIVGDCMSKRNDEEGNDSEEVLRQASKFPNITGAVLDDFFSGVDRSPRMSLEELKDISDRLHSAKPRSLELWIVYYELDLNNKSQEYLDVCDVITFWTWYGYNLDNLESNFDKLNSQVRGKRILAGCYMWDYGGRKPMTIEQMQFQCKTYYDWLKDKRIDGIVFCSNCILDLGLSAVEWTRKWINEIADEEI